MRDRDGGLDGLVGLAFIFIFLAGIALAVVVVIKVLPQIWKGIVEITRMGVPLLARLLGRFLGWPSEEEAVSVACASILGAILWTALGFAGGLLLWIATGPNLTLLLITTIVGAVLGAAAGAAFPQTPPETQDQNLDDFLNNQW